MALKEEIEHSADPEGAALVLDRLAETRPGSADRLAADPGLCRAVVTVAAASPWLARICLTESAALDVLAGLEEVEGPNLMGSTPGVEVARIKRLELLRVAARDLLGLDDLEQVGRNLSHLADRVLQLAYEATARTSDGIAVIGMGKLGACELNYSSDVDVILVGPSIGPDPVRGLDVRPFLALARTAWRVDLDLRPEGRSGPLARSLPSYEAYWDRWAATWEFQALLKARAVAGDATLGGRFEEKAAGRVWSRPFGADELRQVRALKARAEEQVSRRGLGGRELKRGRGGIRDIEFAVQLLQLVHGRADSELRVPSTLGALRALAAGGYVAPSDASALEHAYRFLRQVEHRLQLQEDQQVHTVPAGMSARTQLARVLGYRDRAASTAVAQFDADLRRHQATVRAIHERLFFRPLLESFTTGGPGGQPVTLPPDAVAERLEAFGFADAERTHQAVRELTRGFSRRSQLMQQSLPMLLDWLSHSPNPDLGLLGLRTLAAERHTSEQLTAVCRESPEAARQLCQLLGTGPRFARDIQRHPDVLASLATNEFRVARTRSELDERAERSLAWRSGAGAIEQGLVLFTRGESLRIAARDVLGLDDVDATGGALTDLAEAVIAAALRQVDPQLPFVVVGMGRLGGREMGYSSDLDLMFVYEPLDDMPAAGAAARAEAAAMSLVRMLGGVTPATGAYRVDTALRPEGRQGPQARSLEAFASYYQRWAQVWERQALLRGRLIAGDEDLSRRFEELAREFVWDRPFEPDDIRDIRRTKARIEREKVPPIEDPTFHLKLGPGSLSDIEWTAQLLQLTHGVKATGTIEAIEALTTAGALDQRDASVLIESYRFCERTRNRLQLVRDIPGDSLPSPGPALTTLARSLGTTVTQLRDDYRRVTRRARRVVERLFYDTTALT